MPDMSLSAFIAHIAGAAVEVDHLTHKGLERAAALVEREAKREIGHYQDQAGPFVAWAELADSTKDDRVRKGYSENEPGLREGDMRDSIDHAVGHMEAVVGSNDQKMVYFENGTEKQPPRNALGGSAFRKAEKVAEILGGSVAMALVGEQVVNRVLPISRD